MALFKKNKKEVEEVVEIIPIHELDLFTKPHKKKEILEDGTVKIQLKSKNKYFITISEPLITISSKGFWNFANRGLVGEKTIDLNAIQGVQYKAPSTMLVGYLQFITPGGGDAQRGLKGAVKDENTLVIGSKDEAQLAEQMKEYIERYIRERNQIQGSTTIINQTSNLDELKKLKELLDMGAITEEEFEVQKQILLS